VTELSDVVVTVVTDDKAQLAIFTNKRDNLLQGRRAHLCQLRDNSPKLTSKWKSWRRKQGPLHSKVHGVVDHPGAQRHPLSHDRRRREVFEKVKPVSASSPMMES